MGKIPDYSKVTTLKDDNVFLLDGPDGTKTIVPKSLISELLKKAGTAEILKNININEIPNFQKVPQEDCFLFGNDNNRYAKIESNMLYYEIAKTARPSYKAPLINEIAKIHRNMYRGKYLGDHVTDEQYTMIYNKSFDDLFVGDYWIINNIWWRIVDINYWLNTGDTACYTHHLVIMPDTVLYKANMNDTNVTTGGYVGSKMYTENLTQAKTMINEAFGESHILNHREYLNNAVTNGYPSGGAWYDSKVELPNEIMIYGSYVHTPAGNGSIVPNRYTINKSQLACMRLAGSIINGNRQNYWLRDVVSGAWFAAVYYRGTANCDNASYGYGVRPVFGLVG